ncbi:hypothetical protein [Bifidobacterium choloepi]|uniref:Uncharacterized protein n=1 Tax=Bifidobacterium choloepi TaxID=2614131 RepID=A0A6I5NCL5_9BIFI|nr:hypothetical protein [Bifidobacterium choloepi]NEG69214.1 hypothetical protein [Bifidobacterium choloepi]
MKPTNDNNDSVRKDLPSKIGDRAILCTITYEENGAYAVTEHCSTPDDASDKYREAHRIFPLIAADWWRKSLDDGNPLAEQHADIILPDPKWKCRICIAEAVGIDEHGNIELAIIESDQFALADAVPLSFLFEDFEVSQKEELAAEAELVAAQQTGDETAISQAQLHFDTIGKQAEEIHQRMEERIARLYGENAPN